MAVNLFFLKSTDLHEKKKSKIKDALFFRLINIYIKRKKLSSEIFLFIEFN